MNKDAKPTGSPAARPKLPATPPVELTELGAGLVCDPVTGICAVPEAPTAPAQKPAAAPAPAPKPKA